MFKIYAIALIGLSFCGYLLKQEYNANQVYSTCMAGHYDTDGYKEKACGDLQAKYKYEFLCNSTGQKCWVEKNNEL